MSNTLNLSDYYRRHSIKYRATKVIISLVILLLGGLVYVIYREKSLLMFNWFDSIGISNEIDWLRRLFQGEGIYGWVKYSLPDGLWRFRICLLLTRYGAAKGTLYQFYSYGDCQLWQYSLNVYNILVYYQECLTGQIWPAIYWQ